MIQFLISRGIESQLPETIVDGKIYFCTDTGNLFIDYNTERIHINANKAQMLTYFDEEKNEYVDLDVEALLALIGENSNIYTQDEEPEDAPDGSLWVDTDENLETDGIPIFNLTDLGLPVLVIDEDPQFISADTLEIQQALNKGFVKFVLQGDLGNGPENFSSIVTAAFARNVYQVAEFFWVNNDDTEVRAKMIINITSSGIQAWIETESAALNLPIAEEEVF